VSQRASSHTWQFHFHWSLSAPPRRRRTSRSDAHLKRPKARVVQKICSSGPRFSQSIQHRPKRTFRRHLGRTTGDDKQGPVNVKPGVDPVWCARTSARKLRNRWNAPTRFTDRGWKLVPPPPAHRRGPSARLSGARRNAAQGASRPALVCAAPRHEWRPAGCATEGPPLPRPAPR
jgi:hypothetical protein